MFMHPDLAYIQAKHHQRELIAYADRQRLLNAARRIRRARGHRADPGGNAMARGRPASNLGPCPPRAAVPAQP